MAARRRQSTTRGERIRLSRLSLIAARKERNIHQEDLAKRIGSSRWVVSRIERGHCRIDAVLDRKQITQLRQILGFRKEHRASPGSRRSPGVSQPALFDEAAREDIRKAVKTTEAAVGFELLVDAILEELVSKVAVRLDVDQDVAGRIVSRWLKEGR